MALESAKEELKQVLNQFYGGEVPEAPLTIGKVRENPALIQGKKVKILAYRRAGWLASEVVEGSEVPLDKFAKEDFVRIMEEG
jgi:hypothetical protein